MPFKDPKSEAAVKSNRERAARWRAKNPEASRIVNRRCTDKHRERYRADARARRPGRALQPQVRASWLVQGCKARAKKKGVPFDIETSDVAPALERGVCDMTGLPFTITAGSRGAYSPSIDRIRPDLGYVKGNIRVILWALNAAFGPWGEEVIRGIFASCKS